MSYGYDYDWCGHENCGAPIERWSREWKHRKRELDADHKAVPQTPVGPLDEALFLRADRYAATSMAVAAQTAHDPRVTLTEVLAAHADWDFTMTGRIACICGGWAEPDAGDDLNAGRHRAHVAEVIESEVVEARLAPIRALADEGYNLTRPYGDKCETCGTRYLEAGINLANLSHALDGAEGYEWPIGDAGPFIAWRERPSRSGRQGEGEKAGERHARKWVAFPGKVPVCRDCGADWKPVQRGQCLYCGSDLGPLKPREENR